MKFDKKEFNEGRWTRAEHEAFVRGLELYGKEWKKIATLIPTRSIVQIRTHAQKFFQKIARVNYEKQGKQVPDALKSTAIKSSYNFNALQQALTEHLDSNGRPIKFTTTESGENLLFDPNSSTSESRSTDIKSADESQEIARRGRRPQRRRKSSRYSVALHDLADNDLDFQYLKNDDQNFDIQNGSSDGSSFANNRFSKRARSLSANTKFNFADTISNFGFQSMPEMHISDSNFGHDTFKSSLPVVEEEGSHISPNWSGEEDPLLDFMNNDTEGVTNDFNFMEFDPFYA